MSQNISLASVAEKNSLTSGTPFLICLKVDVISPATLSVVETLYLVKNTEDITVDGQVYTAFPFEIKVQSSAGEMPTATITADDYSRAIQSRMQLYGGGVGFDITIKVVNGSVIAGGSGGGGDNLVSGGTFDTQADVDLWAAYAVPFDVIEHDAGRMKLYSVAEFGTQSIASRTITGLTPGVTYNLTIDAEQGVGTDEMQVAVNLNFVGRATTGELALSFVADASSATVWLYNQNSIAPNTYVWFDNFSVTSAASAGDPGVAQTEVVDVEYFKVIGAAVKGNVVTWTLGDDNPLASPFPRRRQLMDRCSWRYKSGDCKYAGGMPSCDLTLNGLNGCAAHDNDLNFGGFPGINRGNSRFV